MRIEKEYRENGVKITRIAMKKVNKKRVIKGKSKRLAVSKPPTSVRCSSIYNSNIDLTPQGLQDSVASNRMAHSREWGGQ